MNTFAAIAQALADHSAWLADPSPTPAPGGGTPTVHPDGFMNFLITWGVPIFVGIAGIWVMSRAKKGDMNASLTSFSITLLGVVMIAGASLWFIAGQYFVHLAIH